MDKFTYTLDLEFRADLKEVYPLISTPDGLSRWFCDDASQPKKNTFDLVWNNKSHFAKIISRKKNQSIRLGFLPDEDEHVNGELPYVDFSLSKSELDDGVVFLHIVDHSKNTDAEALSSLWSTLTLDLKDIIEEESSLMEANEK